MFTNGKNIVYEFMIQFYSYLYFVNHTLEIKTIWLIIVNKYIQQAIVTDDRSSVDVDITIIDLENVTDSHH